MIISLKLNNSLIYNSPVEFTMRANMHYKKFSCNISEHSDINILKSAILIGPNNSGKTNFVKAISAIQSIMLNRGSGIPANLFSGNPVSEFEITFLNNEEEYVFQIKYDTQKASYIYERFAKATYDTSKNRTEHNWFVRDSVNSVYVCESEELGMAMKLAAQNNILIYLLDTSHFGLLARAKDILIEFASKIDIVDMNNIPIQKTIDILKSTGDSKQKVVDFIKNADLSLEDFRYLSDNELNIKINSEVKPQESVLNVVAPVTDMLHLSSVYNGIAFPSLFYDSTGTKKLTAIASYVIEALEKGRILIVDELDNSLHFKLTRAIIALFNNELNTNAQLICTVHDVSLLDCKKLFRKEQIWFAYKDKEKAYLYSLSEFTSEKDGIRDTSDIIEKYRQGVFGALPEPDLFRSLLGVSENV